MSRILVTIHNLLNGLGYKVVIIDSRDIGRSSYIDASQPTNLI
ncbi:hypothetical protein N4T36_00480 (plasmid) [Acinetobacter baumannii]|nr:hypothetical protein [Acinetobacter baumannii]UWY70942.1 hypothetical protein N4T40_21730 [Acinetobacter baumannii]UWY71242.1 hypothetical protein N4T41_00450 [Acinetobacter baumannii]UWY79135.1 hypothetical protein N4T35_21340 [Acinetobacter baumannii]UWY79631.1 hypothetical protein N4T36_00480 [Acinetobacter baumannii]UWY83791.1 hypothetical protein N4T37_00200 [Acinetobacter baumannii]